MSELDDEIARIAALRGRPADTANYVTEARAIQRRARQIHSSEIRGLFSMPETGDDLRVFDRLPRRSQMVLAELPINASSGKYADLLLRIRDEAALIDAVRDQLPGIMRDWLLDHFGRGHPSARKLA